MRNEPAQTRTSRRAALRRLGAASLLLALTTAGCVVKDELKDGMREMRGEVATARLDAFPDDGQVGATIVQEAGKIDTPHDIINPGHRGNGSSQGLRIGNQILFRATRATLEIA